MLIWVKWFCYAQEQVSADLDFAHVDRPTYQAVRGFLVNEIQRSSSVRIIEELKSVALGRTENFVSSKPRVTKPIRVETFYLRTFSNILLQR